MIRRALFPVCLIVAAALHAAPFLLMRDGGTRAAGTGSNGAGQVTLTAASAELAQQVSDWTRPPEIHTPAGLQAQVAPTMQSLPTPVTTRVQRLVPTRLGLPVLAAGAVADSAPAQPAPPPPPASPPQPRKVQQTPPPPPPAPAAPAPSPASPAENVQERAAGTGKSQAKGDRGPDAATTGDPSRATSLKNRWGAAIIARVERQKRQPRRGAKGTTRLRLTVSSAGRLVAVSIAKSSGNVELDQAALRAVRKARMPRAPKALPSGDYKFSFRMTFAG